MRVLVTGADGFVGPHLVRRLTQAGHDVVACAGPEAADRALDIRDAAAVRALVKEVAPEGVVHLAGWSSVGSSFDRPLDCFAVNALGTAHLFEAVRVGAPRARVLLISSGEVYGPGQHPRSEQDTLLSLSPYAMSKQAAELIAQQYQRSFGVQAIVARAFNHVGLGQEQRFVVPSLLEQVLGVARGQREPVIEVGNLDPVRDFSSVADVVDAYRLLLERGAVGQVYNVCSGRGRSIREVLDELLRLAGVHAEVRVDAARVRPVDIPHLVGAPAKLFSLGWQPRHDPFSSLVPVDLRHPSAPGGAKG
jgi:GDP-4-dehydro-6-deoxy-D-mannose reductase